MDTVEIEVQANFQTIIRSGKAEFNLNGLDPEEYPHLPIIEEENIFKLPTDLLKALIRQTGICSVHLRNTPYLNRCKLKG